MPYCWASDCQQWNLEEQQLFMLRLRGTLVTINLP
ncbi:hypothetical protein PRBEI_2001112300 [Prionailurus iriomotensis]